MVTQLMTQGPRGTWTKAASRHPCGREKQAFLGTWGSAGAAQKEGKQLIPSSLLSLPTCLQGLNQDHEGKVVTLPSRVAHLRTTPALACDHRPHLPQSLQVSKVTLGDTNCFYM